MPRPLIPLRRKDPWIGQVPPTPVAAPAQRVSAALVVAAVGLTGIGRTAPRGAVQRVQPPLSLVTFAPASVRSADIIRRDQRSTPGRVLQVRPPRLFVVFGAASVRQADLWRQTDNRRSIGQALFVRPERLQPGRATPPILAVRQDRRGFAGQALKVSPPRPLVVFGSGSIRQAEVSRRDERGYRGRVVQVQPPRPLVLFAPAAQRAAKLVQKPDARYQAGRNVTSVPPRLRVLFAPPIPRQIQVAARQDDRWRARAAGQVFRSLPSRVAVAVVQLRLKPPTVARQTDNRRTPGRVLQTIPPRPLVVFPAAAVRQADLWKQPDNRRTPGQSLFIRPERLQPGRATPPVVALRQDRRGFAGRVLQVQPPRQFVLFTPAVDRAALVRWADRRFQAGRVVQVAAPRLLVVSGAPRPVTIARGQDSRSLSRRGGIVLRVVRPIVPPVLVRPKPALIVQGIRRVRGQVQISPPRRPTPPCLIRPARPVVRQWLPERGRVVIVRAALSPFVSVPGRNTRGTLIERDKGAGTLLRRDKGRGTLRYT